MIGEMYLSDDLGLTLVGRLATVDSTGLAVAAPTPIGLQVMRTEELKKRRNWRVTVKLDDDHQDLEGTIHEVVFLAHPEELSG